MKEGDKMNTGDELRKEMNELERKIDSFREALPNGKMQSIHIREYLDFNKRVVDLGIEAAKSESGIGGEQGMQWFRRCLKQLTDIPVDAH